MAALDVEEIRALLEEERARLHLIRMALSGEAIDGTAEDLAVQELSLVEEDPADAVTETIERDRDVSILEHVDEQLGDVDRAMERLDLGTYGICEACGRPIGEDRLRARPAARFCVEDQAKAERGVP